MFHNRFLTSESERRQQPCLLTGRKHKAIVVNKEEKLAHPFQQSVIVQEEYNLHPERCCFLCYQPLSEGEQGVDQGSDPSGHLASLLAPELPELTIPSHLVLNHLFRSWPSNSGAPFAKQLFLLVDVKIVFWGCYVTVQLQKEQLEGEHIFKAACGGVSESLF